MNKSHNPIYYDANFSIGKHRGMGKYINNLKFVLENDLNLEVIGLLSSRVKFNKAKYITFGFKNYLLWEQISLLNFSNKVDKAIIFPYNTAPVFLKARNKSFIIIHDLIFMNDYKSNSLLQMFGNKYRKVVLPLIIRKFDNILTVSHYSKSKILEYFDIEPDKIHILPNAIDLKGWNFNSNPSLKERQSYIFHIGGEPDYKNSLLVLKAFALLPDGIKKQFKLKILGIRNQKVRNFYIKTAETLGILNSLELLNYQTDEAIELMYRNSSMFVFPSKEEGFGIPIIEAMKFGCPLICSNASCLPEIAKNAALYFPPHSEYELSQRMLEVLQNQDLTSQRILAGYKIVEEYSLENFKKKVVKLFGRIYV